MHDQTVALPVDVTPEERQNFAESESRAEQGYPEGILCILGGVQEGLQRVRGRGITLRRALRSGLRQRVFVSVDDPRRFGPVRGILGQQVPLHRGVQRLMEGIECGPHSPRRIPSVGQRFEKILNGEGPRLSAGSHQGNR